MALQTFPWKDVLVYEPGAQFKTIIHEAYGGGEQRYSLRDIVKRTFRLNFKASRADVIEVWDFYAARKGAYEPFNFNNPMDSQDYVLRFAEDDLSYEQLSTLFYSQRLTLVGFLQSDNVAGFTDDTWEALVQILQLTEDSWVSNPSGTGVERSVEVEGIVTDTVEIYVRNSATSSGYKALTISKNEMVSVDRAVPFAEIKWSRPSGTDPIIVTLAY